ncbi:MAG: M20/M25/M40 family metallo-hydrolase, partial [Oscillospiraceae bacterium]|nr:M20/M25/M40 family metallo-hydrolase [Oscillospiraceae bacterium]
DIKETLFEIAGTPSVAGFEGELAEICAGYLRRYFPGTEIIQGGVAAMPENPESAILLDAHIDQIGMVCTHVTDDGFVKVGNAGGLDCRLLAGQAVKIHSRSGVIDAVITSVPPHLASKSEKVPGIEDILIDTGLPKQALDGAVGYPVSFDMPCRELAGGRVTGPSLDDAAGVAAILYALSLMPEKKLKNTAVLFSFGEEIGGRGAMTSVYGMKFAAAVAVDVSFALTNGEDEDKCGKMGKGPMIGISPSLDRELSYRLISIAEKAGIPYQREVMPGLTSTNADRFAVSGSGIKSGTVSVPLKYMHTPVECADLKDIELTGRLLAEAVSE